MLQHVDTNGRESEPKTTDETLRGSALGELGQWCLWPATQNGDASI